MPLYALFCLLRPTLTKPQKAAAIKHSAMTVLNNDGIVTDIVSHGTYRLAKAIKSGNERFTDVSVLRKLPGS